MRTQRSLATAAATAALVLGLLLATPHAAAQTETVLHAFSGKDGISPSLSLVFDSAGNLYGTTAQGGSSNNGTVFELSPSGSSWAEKTLISFNGGGGGSQPVGGVIVDSSGNLYGTTKEGGSNGAGVVFELSPSHARSWTEKILHNFGSGKDGRFPTAALVFDTDGNLYGTTQGGGAYGDGTESKGGIAFKLAPGSTGWTETVIHSFGNGTDGANPRCSVVLDSSGNVYGTAMNGGAHSEGAVFKISPQAHGGWKEQVLYSFNPAIDFGDGVQPVAGLVFDESGNLYGTTTVGGEQGGGTVFELSPASGGMWKETVISFFEQPFFQPSNLYSGVVFDSAGNLYGATWRGAGVSTLFDGTLYKLTPAGDGTWTNTELVPFGANHGATPGIGSLVLDGSGNIYGATQAGGRNKDGVVFKITP
jgi:uncharacterized repeat protein (TIGR03803 family)